MATRKWFVRDGDEELGPLGPNGLRRMVRRGQVLPGTMVRREDHSLAIRADAVRGLFDDTRSGAATAKVHGPFTSLRAIGWVNAGAMATWVAVGVLGVYTANAQRGRAIAIAMDDSMPVPGAPPSTSLLEAGAPFLGIGSVPALALFAVTGALFTYWLRSARLNLPHLIRAHLRFAPSWTIACWFVPVLNLYRPYQVLEEIDRLGAEAAAGGDPSVRARSALLLPWWIGTLAMGGFALAYRLAPAATAEEVADAARLHLATAASVAVAALFGAFVFLRITALQERAHEDHPRPVRLRHRLRRGDGAVSA